MSKRKITWKLPTLVAIVATVGAGGVSASNSLLVPSIADVDIQAEGRTVDTYVHDLNAFHKRAAEFSRKRSLTRDQFNSLERESDGLKQRLSSVQSALNEIMKKLKAAGQWDGLDTRMSKISNPTFREVADEIGFKKTLQELALGATSNADQISAPLEPLKIKIAQSPETEAQASKLAWQPTFVT